MEQVIAKKYGLRPWTVIRWRDLYLEGGAEGLSKGKLSGSRKTNRELQLEKENAALREEVEILKKAAAFLANVKRD
jgi:transposase